MNIINAGRPVKGIQHSYSISLIRLASLIFIVTCHIQQYLNIELAWWFNVGVQIFLCISGFLYGQKEIGVISVFYYNRFKKILVPYYIVFTFFCILEMLFARSVFNFRHAISGLLCRETIVGGQHLWFIRYILLCYILTPLLHEYRKKVKNTKSMWCFALISVCIVSIWFLLFNQVFETAWMACYVIGYSLGVNEKEKFISDQLLLFLVGIVAVLGNAVQIYCSYIVHTSFPGYGYFCDFNHTFLGVFLFLLLKIPFDKINFSEKLKLVLDLADKYSYETYLVHQFFILGPFTLMALTPFVGLNIVVIIVCIVLSAWLLKKAEKYVEGLLPKPASLD